MTEVQLFVFKECVLVVFVFIQRHLAIAAVGQRLQGQIAMGWRFGSTPSIMTPSGVIPTGTKVMAMATPAPGN